MAAMGSYNSDSVRKVPYRNSIHLKANLYIRSLRKMDYNLCSTLLNPNIINHNNNHNHKWRKVIGMEQSLAPSYRKAFSGHGDWDHIPTNYTLLGPWTCFFFAFAFQNP